MSRLTAATAVRTAAPAGLASASFLLLTLGSMDWLGYAAGCLVIFVIFATHRRPALGTDVPARLVVTAGVLAHAATGAGAAHPVALTLTGTGLLGLLLAEPLLHRLARPWYHAAHLPARPAPPAALVENGTAWAVNSAAVLLTGLGAVLAVPAWWLLAPPAGAAVLAGWLVVDGAHRWRTSHRAELTRLTHALAEHHPRFLLFFSAPPGSEYQAKMWLPYLDQLDEPYLVVLTEHHNAAPVAAATGAPVVVCETFEVLDAVMVPSLRVAFYVNNGAKNAHCVRFTWLTHVQLYHGDSDKAVTASPLNQHFDRIFVAGQAAIDRFAAYGVDIPADRFRIVGRPQVARLAFSEQPIDEVGEQVVLYAPTWVGAHADGNYCSLSIAEPIVEELLARGVTVILRPHPYTARNQESAAQLQRAEQLLARDRARTGRPHRWGAAATRELSLFDCMDRSHAMICDVSSVASDYLYTGKPFAITDMTGEGDRFPRAFPVARAAYVLWRDAGNVAAVLADLLAHDRLRATRRELRTYYLGDIPTQRYPEAFLTEARRCLAEARRGPGGSSGTTPGGAGRTARAAPDDQLWSGV